jgi:hypothetical protein
LAETWLKKGYTPKADLNRDLIVNFKDLAIMGDYWLGPGRDLVDLSREPPGRAQRPDPPDGALETTRSSLSWRGDDYALSHDVYFGTTSPPTFQGNQTSITFDPCGMAPETTYYWRIDEVNPFGTTAGEVWTFTTAPPPNQATDPSPADKANGIGEFPDLSWTPGAHTTSHDVYFGPNSPGAFQGNQTGKTFRPSDLEPNTTYYWRIDEVNPFGTTTGQIWTFTTVSEPFGPATNPHPRDGAVDIAYGSTLRWQAGFDATSHDVYFGPNSTPEFQGNQTSTTFRPTNRRPGTTYFWRIDEINPRGTTEGEIWSFTTADGPRPASSPDPCDGAVGIGHTPTLSWKEGSDASSNDVYFGTTSPGTFQGNQRSETFSPGGLSPATTYFWRIDSVNPWGTTTGDVWTFTTGDTPPGPASNPDPCDGAVDVYVGSYILLQWEAGSDAVSHDVYFGTTNPPTFQVNKSFTKYWPSKPQPGTKYYWRIDEVSPFGTTTGEVWSFTTAPSPEGSASAPDPCDGAVDVGPSPVLRWKGGFDAESQDVYFGGTSPVTFQGNQTSTEFSPANLEPATTYYWRIDQVNSFGTKTGRVWSFTTGAAPDESATNPYPPDGAVGIDPKTLLTWSPAPRAAYHGIWIGTSGHLDFHGNRTTIPYGPVTLLPGRTYIWRIDERNGWGVVEGDLWTFTTKPVPDE